MTSFTWIEDALGEELVASAEQSAMRRRLYPIVEKPVDGDADAVIRHVVGALELQLLELVPEHPEDARRTASSAFQLARTLQGPNSPLERVRWLTRLGVLAILGDRVADVRRLLKEEQLQEIRAKEASWGERVQVTSLEVWLRIIRKDGWSDLDAVQESISTLRSLQESREGEFLTSLPEAERRKAAWQLVVAYHQAKAAELIGTFTTQGQVGERFDIRQQLEAQFDRASAAAARGGLVEEEALIRLLSVAAVSLVNSSIWTVTRAVNSRVTQFVQSLVDRSRRAPIFEMLPPQRKALREDGLLGSGHRSVVVSLPTSSGKTFIAQFRILQALNQFDHENGWVAYVAPTRALVNQMATRLRRDYSDLGIVVEKVSPALEVDGIEADLLTDRSPNRLFRVLVTTPEKLDLMLRSGWEERIGRPLTLVVVDEAHGLASPNRGLKLELLLATINRECRHAQFLLLTPFIRNAEEIASWLAPESHKNVELGLMWTPNDRAIAIARPIRGDGRGDFHVQLQTKQVSQDTLGVPEALDYPRNRPLGLSWSAAKSQGNLAAATAQLMKERGPVIVLAGRPDWAWSIAETLKVEENRSIGTGEDVRLVQQFVKAELGPDFPLVELLSHGIGLHHSGLPDEVKVLTEWLVERGALRILVATTTIAQGVNFPVTGVVLATHQYPYGQDMPAEDFWNLAGRAGRVDQGDFGLIALAASNPEKERILDRFLGRAIGSLNSTLVEMVQKAMAQGDLLSLENLSHEPRWSAFLQYLAHSYRLIGDHDEFASEAEQVLRGTLGFQALRKSHPGWADRLVQGVFNYAERLEGKPLKLVDGTGFSWESVSATLARLSEEKIDGDVWKAPLFVPGNESLPRMMGVLLQVPELRDLLKEATGGPTPDGDKLARMVTDWVGGLSLRELSERHFGTTDVADITKCCKSIFGRLTQTASWGLSALQVLTMRDIDDLPESEQRRFRNIPAKVFYGVQSESALLLRMTGVPRTAAESLADALEVGPDESITNVRRKLQNSEDAVWKAAVGDLGPTYRNVWRILEGHSDEV